MPTIIQVQCVDQQLMVTNSPVIAAGGINEDVVQFSFSEHWDGFAKTAVFWQNIEDSYSVLIDDDNQCVVPAEVLSTEGKLCFGVFGVLEDCTRTSTILSYNIKKGVSEGQTPEATQTIYEQILSAMASYASQAAASAQAAQESAESVDPSELIHNNEKGVANGVASLGSNAKIPTEQIPDIEDLGGVSPSTLRTAQIGTSWTGTAIPYSQTISVTGVKANSAVEISLPSTATEAQVKAFNRLVLVDGGQAANSITLKAFGELNTISIPINVIVRGDL